MQDSFRHRGRQRSGWFRTCTIIPICVIHSVQCTLYSVQPWMRDLSFTSKTYQPTVMPLSLMYGHCIQLRIRYLRFLHSGWSISCCSLIRDIRTLRTAPHKISKISPLQLIYQLLFLYPWCTLYSPDKRSKISPLRLIFQLLFLYPWCTLYSPG